MITRENHEQHAQDYLDGTLDPAVREAFEAFLRLHPGEREALEGLEEIRLHPRPLPFEGKERLKRLDEDRRDYLVIAAAEDALTGEERAFVEDACDREAFAASVAAYRRARLSPDRSLRFPGKGRLHRRASFPLRWRVALAGGVAAVALSCGLFLWPRERAGGEATAVTLARTVRIAAGAPVMEAAKPAVAPLVARPVVRPASAPASAPVSRPVQPRDFAPVAALRDPVASLVAPREASFPASPDRLVARALPSLPASPRLVITVHPFELLRDNGVVSSVVALLGMGREIAEDLSERVTLSLEMIKNGASPVTY
ncbi:MAG: hypothetical protein LBK12_02845 [Odoribacteraceae bacterium]|jgi:hypothetical protein|nr:hypothetical protein [Odoribacteraceae bacterium]